MPTINTINGLRIVTEHDGLYVQALDPEPTEIKAVLAFLADPGWEPIS